MLTKVRLIKSILIVISLLLLNGCSTNANANEKGYIYKSDSEAIFINWTEDKDHKIVGQLQITDLTNSGIQSSNHSLNGVLNDNKISITITGSVLNDSNSGKVFTGTLNGASKLSLLLPASNGTMNSLDFIAGTVEDFNNAVKALTDKNAKIQADKQANAQKADQLATQQGIIKSLAGIDKKIKNDTSDLTNTNYTEILGRYDEALQRMNEHYAKLKSDGSVQPLTGVQKGIVETELGTLQVDLGTLETIGGSMEVKNNELQTYIKRLQEDINNYNSLWSSYQNFGGQGNSITADDKSSSISNAQAQISKAFETQRSTQAQVDSYNKQAKDLYSTAESFVNGLKPVN